MRIEDRLGTYEEVVAQAPAHGATMAAIRSMAHALHPEGVEHASRRERSVSWGFEGGKTRHWWACMIPHRTHVNLGFFQGVALPDPERLLEGSGKRLRHVKLATPAAAAATGVCDLMTAALAERRAALSPT